MFDLVFNFSISVMHGWLAKWSKQQIITLSIWVTHLLGYPGFFLSSRLTHLTQGNPLNISMFQTNPPNPPIFSKSQGNPAAGLP